MGSITTPTDAPQQALPEAVSVSLQELQDGTVSLDTLERAFGPDSLGIILVRDLPEKFAELRREVLSLSSYLANLPEEELAKLEIPSAKYNVGWSCGKETLADGRYDTLKGSYYANPIHDAALEAKARELYPHVVEMVTPNVWPSEAVLPGFEAKFEALCRLIVDVAALVARSCDRYGVAKLEGYKEGTLEEIVRTSVSTKARLLHYFPPPPAPATPETSATTTSSSPTKPDDDWCATHTDLGALTGLTSQMFIDEAAHPPQQTNSNSATPSPLPELPTHPDPKAGLWIRDRAGRTTQVHIPRDSLAFQTGMALQQITRGKLRAVPHFVRGGKVDGPESEGMKVARNTLAVFTQPNLWVCVDEETGRDFAGLAEEVITKGI